MDRNDWKAGIEAPEDVVSERYAPVPGAEDDLEATEALKRRPTHEEIFKPREPGPHPRP